jgi:hypothetical protein
MMFVMGQLRRLSESGGAVVACLITVALLAGPLCTPACSGMPCFARSAPAAESGNCHRMAGNARTHFNLGPVARACGLRDAAPAVLSRPVADEFTGATDGGECGLASTNINVYAPQVADASALLSNSSSSPPPDWQPFFASTLILRI